MKAVGYKQLLMRDVALSLLAFVAWYSFSHHTAGSGYLADFLGVVLGIGLAFIAQSAHEWGHIVGGLVGRSTMAPGTSLSSFSNFTYDSKANNKPQFLLMSFAGFAMTALMVFLFFNYLPAGELATRVAQGGLLFLVALGVVIELPLVIWALVAKGLPPIDTKLG